MKTTAETNPYLNEKAIADTELCLFDETGKALRPDLAYYGCPSCGQQERKEVRTALGSRAAAYRYVRCIRCRFVYPWPRLSREALLAWGNGSWLNQHLERSLKEVRYWPDYIPFPEPEFRRLAGRKVLEVGPGLGQFLDYLRHLGCEAIGVELNVVAAHVCRARGLAVIEGPFEEELLKRHPLPSDFDAVVFLESIYHLFDLKEALNVATRLLRPGGQLIVKAFDVDSIPIRFFPRISLGIDGLSIPINGSAKTYGRAVSQAGFRVRRVARCPGQPLQYLGLSKSTFDGTIGPLLWRVGNRLLNETLAFSRQSRNFVLFAEKP